MTTDDAAGAAARWPALSFETFAWEPGPGLEGVTRAERAAVGRPYAAAVVPEISGLSPAPRPQVVAQAEEAVAEVRAFDAETDEPGSRGPGGPPALDAILLRSESASSSQIEQLTASARAVAEAELTGTGRGNAAVVAANVDAMTAAIALADRLDADAVLRMQAALLGGTSPHLVGWREEPVWIGAPGSTPVTAEFVPPHHTRIEAAIADLVDFMARDDLPVLIQAAVAHAQFETIHPFADGNGRTGRALVHALLRAKGVTRHVTVPVSGGLLHDRAGYVAALDAYRRGEIEPIVTAFALAGLRAVQHGRTMRRRLDDVRAQWRQRVRARSDSAVWRLLDVVVAHPVLDAATAAAALGIAEPNVHRHLRVLTEAGVLVGRQHYPDRRTLWRSPDVLGVLDDYAADVGRRSR
ncbi:Fic family protein [Humibacillus xanthopallidus]|uniref:Fic family protein n=1 Tax=Humibacillus xanthopallidus TaxID=412689 RepID=A0A543PSF5_9MICO|nr:Fic family protein [Humibacillus xanthopallidus]TQN47010.1 Fic family protein [Humibacillus xanthopallidus]